MQIIMYVTTKVLYFVRTCLARKNMEIHLGFTLWSSFNNLLKVPWSKYLLGEYDKYVYKVYNNLSATFQAYQLKVE
jgi:hypothetical protein